MKPRGSRELDARLCMEMAEAEVQGRGSTLNRRNGCSGHYVCRVSNRRNLDVDRTIL